MELILLNNVLFFIKKQKKYTFLFLIKMTEVSINARNQLSK